MPPSSPGRPAGRRLYRWRAILQASFAMCGVWGIIAAGGFADILARGFSLPQVIPSAVAFAASASIPAFVVLTVTLVLTFRFGRAYCAVICPLGAYQDAAARARWRGKAPRYSFAKEPKVLKIAVLAAVAATAVAATVFAGSQSLVAAFDPFSLFVRGIGEGFRPIAWGLSRMSRIISRATGLPSLALYDFVFLPDVFVAALAPFLLIGAVAVFRGRWYCDAICPVGTVLGLCASRPSFRLEVSRQTCVKCGACERACRTRCVDTKSGTAFPEINEGRCVRCFACVAVCPTQAIRFAKGKKPRRDFPSAENGITRREFLVAGGAAAAGAGLALLPKALASGGGGRVTLGGIPREAASPPGSMSVGRFSLRCTSCQLCVSRCPTKVLVPAPLASGFRGPLQPFMDFSGAYCAYDCVVCGKVCPSGAIQPLSLSAKKTAKIGESRLTLSRCIVVSKKTACGACAERCPTGAVFMTEPGGKALPEPRLKPEICIGCGACEMSCPAEPLRAIWVEGLATHGTAELPVKGGDHAVPAEDFPF